MDITEILDESKTGAWNRVLLLLNKIFGFRSGSTIRRVGQKFDQKTGCHIIYLEYQVRAQNQPRIPKKPSKVKLTPDDDKK